MHSFSSKTIWQFLAAILIASIFSSLPARADELKMRDGMIVQADQIWESNGQIWFRQGQTVRSVPKSEVLAFGAKLPSNETAKNLPAITNRRSKHQSFTATPTKQEPKQNLPTAENAKPVTRIIFKDGAQIDVDVSWEVGNKIGYRLGTMSSFIEKSGVQQVLINYSSSQTNTEAITTQGNLLYSTGSANLDNLITVNATKHNIDPLLIYFVMRQESSFKVRAVSRVGARGLMQLMPATARQLGVRNIDDPNENVEAGARHLKYLLERYSGDVNLVLAAYNAGEDAVARYGNRVPPYRETQNYVRNIGWAYYRARQ